MSNTNKRLLFSDEPKPDESFIGYLLRLTEINRYETIAWILQLSGIKKYAHSKYGIVFDSSLNLLELSRLTDVELAKLTPLLYPPTKKENEKKATSHLVFGNPVPKYLIRTGRPKICTLCLDEEPYARKAWELAPVTTCPIHKCLLLDECPNCKTSITWSREFVSTCVCKYDWRTLQPTNVKQSETLVTARIFQLCNLPIDNNVSGTVIDKNNPLYDLNLSEFLSILFFIAGQYEGVIDTTGKKLAPSKRHIDIHKLLCRAYKVFDNWPASYFSFLDWRRNHTPDSRHTHGLRRDFHQYKYALYGQFAGQCYTFMRGAFEEYITQHWEGGYVTSLKRICGDVRDTKRYFSVAEAKRYLKVTVKSIEGLIKAGKLKTVEHQQGSRRLVLIEVASAHDLKNELCDSLYLRQTACLLGTHDERIKDLVKAGLLTPLRGPIIDGCTDWKFSSKEVNTLLRSLRERVHKNKSQPKNKKLSFSSALKSLQHLNVKFENFVKDILEGRIAPCGKSGDRVIHDFMFLVSEFKEYRGAKLRDIVGDVLSLREAARALSIGTNTSYILARNNILQANTIPIVKAEGLLVTRQDLALFDSTYISLGTIVRHLQTNSRYVLNLLSSKGINSILELGVGKSSIGIFRRAELVAAGLDYLCQTKKDISNKTQEIEAVS